jgi:DMSO/TMAO reductase YedYZ molybdopterin-dependent catalytic subunit
MNAHLDGSTRTELEGVRQQVGHDLFEARGVPHARDRVVHVDPHRAAGAAQLEPEVLDDLAAGLPDTVDYSIEIVGGTHSPITLTYADLKALGLVEKSNVSYIGDDGLDYTGDFVGVPMEAILDKAGLPAGNLSYNVSAADGEHMTYTPIQAGKAIIALKKNGAALTGNITEDPLHIVLPGGPYCHWIVLPTRIEIITDQPAVYCAPGNACNNSANMGNS